MTHELSQPLEDEHDAHPVLRRPIERRDFLKAAGILSLGATFGTAAAPAGVASMRSSVLQGACTLTPALTAGPFYLDLDLYRYDITEGLPGVPLYMFVRVVDEDGCTPLPGAVVELWQTEALGKYSGFASQGTAGQTWMRGIQVAGADGVASFKTIYPGWYPGRTTHVHAKINPDLNSELTTQLYFHDPLTARIYGLPPYDVRGQKNTSNSQDGFFRKKTQMTTLGAPSFGFSSIFVVAGITIVIDWP